VWSNFLDCIVYISEWVVVARCECSVVVSLSGGAVVVLLILIELLLFGTVSRDVSRLFAIEAESFP
jgi:hypothetical protein